MRYFLFFVSVLLLPSGGFAKFLDVDTTHPYYYAIAHLSEEGVVQGYPTDGGFIFDTQSTINRAEALKVILLSAGISSQKTDLIFTDVKNNDWFAPFVSEAYDLKIVRGFADNTFRPGTKVTRAEFTKMALLTFGFDIQTLEEGEDWYIPFMETASTYRLFASSKEPHEFLTRGEAVEFLYRSIKVKDGKFKDPYSFSGQGLASFYNEGFAGNSTANGETYDPYSLTAAHRTLPFGTRLRVYNESDDFVVVRINDRGPYHQFRVLDLSEAAFSHLAPLSRGVINVRFEVLSDPKDDVQKIPKEIEPEVSQTPQTRIFPGEIEAHLDSKKLKLEVSEKKVDTLSSYTPLFSGSVKHLAKDFFPNIELRDTVPQKVQLGQTFYIAGHTLEIEDHDKVTIFFQNKRTRKQKLFTAPLRGGRDFSVLVSFFEKGTFDMGIVLGENRNSRVGEIEVTGVVNNRRYPASNFVFKSMLNDSFNGEKITFSWISDKNRISRLVFSQNGIRKNTFFNGGMSRFTFDYDFFQDFQKDLVLDIELFQAQSKDGSLDRQFTNWEKVYTKRYKILEKFEHGVNQGIHFSNWDYYYRNLNPLRIFGTFDVSGELNNLVYITNAGGSVETVPLVVEGNRLQFSFTPKAFGKHVVEIVGVSGEILFNRAIYFSESLVLPVGGIESIVNLNRSDVPFARLWLNKFREQNKVSSLKGDINLDSVAQNYAARMANENFFSHYSPEGEGIKGRVAHLNLLSFGENLSFGSTFELALEGLRNSGSHRKNMLSPQWKKVGIGIAQNKKGEFYLVQIFSK